MPYRTEWTPAEFYFEHKGVEIFRTYNENEIENGPLNYYFATSPDPDIYDPEATGVFDVRELSTWKEFDPGHEPQTDFDDPGRVKQLIAAIHRRDEAIKSAIRAAVDLGELIPYKESEHLNNH